MPELSHSTPFHLSYHYKIIPQPITIASPPIIPIVDDTRLAEQEARVEKLESKMRLYEGSFTQNEKDGILVASFDRNSLLYQNT